ncbi:MAG: hypothetical protein J6W14_02095, partial [Clostridia bacterium]|nr:hypothetical protein [Clostridia bacterium]
QIKTAEAFFQKRRITACCDPSLLKESLCSFDLEGRQELQRFGVINCYVKGIFSLLHAYCSTSRYVCQQFCQNFVKICLQIEV